MCIMPSVIIASGIRYVNDMMWHVTSRSLSYHIRYVNDMMMLHDTSLSLSYHYVAQTCQWFYAKFVHNDGKGFPLGDPPFYGLPQDAGGGGWRQGRRVERKRV